MFHTISIDYLQSSSHASASISDGIRQSPRGERETDPTFGPSDMTERFHWFLKKRVINSLDTPCLVPTPIVSGTATSVFVSGGNNSKKPATSQAISQTNSPIDFCKDDQITESFADWLGDEILPDYMEKNYKLNTSQYQIGYSNVFRDACNSDTWGNDPHPSTKLRENALILANPKIRAQMGCKAPLEKYKYCKVEAPLSSGSTGLSTSPEIPELDDSSIAK